uniref:Endoplasmic reticulum metallopeptidase 1 n=1 Tax=Ursus maritimus TaxID=29073 RepID=A0A452UP95_URSMA
MLEVLRVLSASSEALHHAVIFLFNGAEENVLQASHGFITQHPWASLIRAFINLEAAGVGGKELVFQTGPENPWLVQAYVSAAKHPFASVVAQEVFQSGIIPSDTDFRIYRDFGNIPGIDLAFIENGYIYHTKYDTADRILTDSIQRAGDNILAVLKYLATSDMLPSSSKYRHGNMVFFDVLGLFVIAYPSRVGSIINSVVVMAVVLYLGKKLLQPKHKIAGNYMKDFFCALGITLISWFTCLVTVLILAVFVSLIGQSLSWYNHFYVSVCLYGTAAVAKIILIHTLAKKFYYVVSVRPVYGFLFAASEDGRQIPVGFVVGFLSQQTLFGTMIENWLQNRVNFLEGIFRGFGGLPCAAELSVFGCSSLPLRNLARGHSLPGGTHCPPCSGSSGTWRGYMGGICCPLSYT